MGLCLEVCVILVVAGLGSQGTVMCLISSVQDVAEDLYCTGAGILLEPSASRCRRSNCSETFKCEGKSGTWSSSKCKDYLE